ncbi:hypothetical protein FRB99_002358, partial [Tulasnella sp. 403]
NHTALIRHLSTPTLISGKLYWPLPALAALTIQADDCTPEEILDMVESRYGSKKAMLRAQFPSRFASLVINGPGKTLED